MKVCCVVMGGYVNGYGIINELYDKTNSDIILFDTQTVLASKSNKITAFKKIKYNNEDIYNAIVQLKESYEKIIIFPTDDLFVEILYNLYDKLKSFCFIPLNPKTYLRAVTKDFQYQCAKELNIPIPRSIIITKNTDLLDAIKSLQYPIIIKPTIRDDLKNDVFRNIILENESNFVENKKKIESFLNKGISFLVSEFIEGGDETLYSHVGYRDKDGKIRADWIGHKLSQYPQHFGVVSSGISEASEIVREQSKKILEKMDVHGLFQTEFKYDCKDNKYKLMEVNLRSMMWNKIGFAIGIYVNYALYKDAINEAFSQKYKEQKIIHFVYMKHEILNLLFSKNYWKKFKNNVFVKNRIFAIYNKDDIKPFLFDTQNLLRNIIGQTLRILKIKG